jgi:anti-sigma regulatory factor (Ser/Thr protein kinase)
LTPPSKPRSEPPEIGRCAFPASLEDVQRVLAFVDGLAEKSGVAAETGSRLGLALEEWVTNLCRHAYGQAGGTIEVAVCAGDGTFVVEITDEGPEFDPTTRPDPDVGASLADRLPGGLGLLLIRRMVDDVRYRREGRRNVLSLTVATPHS